MTGFNPNWPHGHRLRAGQPAELRGKINNKWLVVVTDGSGFQWSGQWDSAGKWDGADINTRDLINAPAPKRTWDVVAVEYEDGSVGLLHRIELVLGEDDSRKIVASGTLTEGEGMEEKP